MDFSELLTVHDVAQILKVPISWVYDHARARGRDQIPHLKLGKYLRFTEAEIASWVAARREAVGAGRRNN